MPRTFKSTDYKGKEFAGQKFTIQVAPEDCTGCGICVSVCPAKDKSNPKHKAIDMTPQMPLREAEAKNYKFFLDLPEVDRTTLKLDVKGTPVHAAPLRVLRRLRRLRRDALRQAAHPALRRPRPHRQRHGLLLHLRRQPAHHALHAPTRDGRGPAWCNSLFEDNAEFGFGMRLAVDKNQEQALEMLARLAAIVGDELVAGIVNADQTTEAGIKAQRERVAALKEQAGRLQDPRGQAARCSWPTTWSRRASGSSAATAGPTTSATAASTTSWPRAAT